MIELGYKEGTKVAVISTDETGQQDKQIKGHYNQGDEQTGEGQGVFINDQNIDNTEEAMETLGHELAHAQDDANGDFKAGDADQGRYAENYGEDFADYAGFASETFGAGELAGSNHRNLGNTEAERTRNTALLEQNNQTYKNTDKQRGDDAVDIIWDIANIAYDLGKAGYALAKGDEALLEEALKDLAADTVAALIPGLPAGTSKLAKIAAKKLKDGKKLTKKESEALSQAVEAKKAQRQGDAQTPPITSGTSKSGGNNTDIPNIGSKHPNPDIQKNIDETMGHILEGTNPPRKIGGSGNREWGKKYENRDNDLPDLGDGGYKEYRVRPTESGGSNNVHRIVVGKDGNVYYSNTHYGTSSTHKGPAFYSAGKLSPEQIAKLFK